MKRTRTAYEKYLNRMGVSEDDKKYNGGRIPDCVKYSGWLRKKRSYCVRSWVSGI